MVRPILERTPSFEQEYCSMRQYLHRFRSGRNRSLAVFPTCWARSRCPRQGVSVHARRRHRWTRARESCVPVQEPSGESLNGLSSRSWRGARERRGCERAERAAAPWSPSTLEHQALCAVCAPARETPKPCWMDASSGSSRYAPHASGSCLCACGSELNVREQRDGPASPSSHAVFLLFCCCAVFVVVWGRCRMGSDERR